MHYRARQFDPHTTEDMGTWNERSVSDQKCKYAVAIERTITCCLLQARINESDSTEFSQVLTTTALSDNALRQVNWLHFSKSVSMVVFGRGRENQGYITVVSLRKLLRVQLNHGVKRKRTRRGRSCTSTQAVRGKMPVGAKY